jgi:hypothetical protein
MAGRNKPKQIMKARLFFAALVLALMSTVATQATPVEVVPSKHKNLFVFTTARTMRGAEVRVYFSNGDLVTTQRLRKRKMIIDFCDARSGDYTIVVQKGRTVEKFTYVRR